MVKDKQNKHFVIYIVMKKVNVSILQKNYTVKELFKILKNIS